jgi:hypothetical protein
MKTLICVTSLLVLSCIPLLSQEQDKDATAANPSQSTKEQSAKRDKDDESGCEKPSRASGYALDLRLPKATRQVKTYNTDYPDTHKHKPICLSKKAGDTILWLSGKGNHFRLEISPEDPQKCGRHPFKKDPPSDAITGYYSDELRPDVPVRCVYDVKFNKEGEKAADPHIQIGP